MSLKIQSRLHAQPERFAGSLLFLFLAAIIHTFIFFIPQNFWIPNSHKVSRTKIETIDVKKIEAIKKQWKDQSLQFYRVENAPTPVTNLKENPQARYFSDRTVRVEKETRTKEKTTTFGGETQHERPQSELTFKKTNQPLIKNLGVPLPRPKSPLTDWSSQEKNQTPDKSTQESASQTVNDDRLPIGAQNVLNTQESIYYSFYARLYDAIGPLWQNKIRSLPLVSRKVFPGEYSTIVEVYFNQQGDLSRMTIAQESGIPEFDRAVLDSWKKIGRFPNPPQGLLKNGEIRTGWTFTVHVGNSSQFNYKSPERIY